MELAQKLADIIQKIRQPAKSGTSNFPTFEYSTRDDIFAVIRDELAKRGIAICPSTTIHSVDPTGETTSSGKKEMRVRVELRVLLIDGESGETLESTWVGESKTADDRGLQQAATQAIRFWATNTFLLMDGSGEQSYANKTSGSSQNVHRQEASTQNPQKAISDRLEGLGFSKKQINTYLNGYIADIYGVESVEQVPPHKLHKWADGMARTDDDEARDKAMKHINDAA